jgi:rubrerythrin
MFNNDKEKVNYLASLIWYSKVNNEISSVENIFIEEIQKRIKAKKSHYNEALIEANKKNFEIKGFSKFVLNVLLIQDLIKLLFIGEKQDYLSKLKLTASELNITEQQFENLTKEVEYEIKALDTNIKCKNCGFHFGGQAKFCPNCGTKLDKFEKVDKADYEIPNKGISIEFRETTSSNFSDMLKYFENAPIKDKATSKNA